MRVSEEQVRWFRARRSFLAGPLAPDAPHAARRILGAQAQQLNPALWGLSLRTRSRPTAARLERMLLDPEERRLVRTWGQRDTLHLYAPDDWATVVAARREWPRSSRSGAMPGPDALDVARRAFEDARGPLLRRDLFGRIPPAFVEEVAAHPGVAESKAERFAAGRLIWSLAMEGALCFAHRDGAEQAYCHRRHWLPDLSWPEEADPAAATRELARRYLGVHGPATAADLAHFFGTRVTTVRGWLRELRDELTEVECGERAGLWALAEDLEALAEESPEADAWPVRLLPMWDGHLMRHRDKSWLLEDPAEQPEVWAKAGVVRATVLERGRVVATWSAKATTRKVEIEIAPLGSWRPGLLPGVEDEVADYAAHLGLEESDVRVADAAG